MRLVVLVNRKDPHKPRYIVLASTDLELEARRLVQFYVARFQIEFLFRDSKQFTGLADCQARDEAALSFHFNASLATLNLARAELARVSARERLTRLLNNVLDFSRIEQEGKTYRLSPASLADVIRAAARALEYQLTQAGFVTL